MSGPAKRAATYEDLLQVPDHLIAEIIDGELITSPRPAVKHARSSSVLNTIVGGPFDHAPGGPGGWWILLEPELHLGPDILVPDLAGWRRERMPAPPDAAYIELAPDWVCEVLSPSTETLDRMRKMRVYLKAGVGHVWLIDPTRKSLEVFRRQEDQWIYVGAWAGEEHVRAEPFDAIDLDLSALWLPESPESVERA